MAQETVRGSAVRHDEGCDPGNSPHTSRPSPGRGPRHECAQVTRFSLCTDARNFEKSPQGKFTAQERLIPEVAVVTVAEVLLGGVSHVGPGMRPARGKECSKPPADTVAATEPPPRRPPGRTWRPAREERPSHPGLPSAGGGRGAGVRSGPHRLPEGCSSDEEPAGRGTRSGRGLGAGSGRAAWAPEDGGRGTRTLGARGGRAQGMRGQVPAGSRSRAPRPRHGHQAEGARSEWRLHEPEAKFEHNFLNHWEICTACQNFQ
eukprot:XP_022263791.1 uncharacterized protein LOC111091668 [Canis lupus familiaris]